MSRHPVPSDQDLQVMYDKIALYDLNQLYCRAADRRDYKLLASLYHPDSTDDRSPVFKGSGLDFVKWASGTVTQLQATNHVIAGAIFHVQGDYAEGEVHLIAWLLSAAEPQSETIRHGRYIDRYERRDGVWSILERSIVYDWFETRPYHKELHDKIARGAVMGQASEKDPMYSKLKLVKFGSR